MLVFIYLFSGTHSTATNGHHVAASSKSQFSGTDSVTGKSQFSVPDSVDSGVELSVSGQYMPEMTPVQEHDEEEYQESSGTTLFTK